MYRVEELILNCENFMYNGVYEFNEFEENVLRNLIVIYWSKMVRNWLWNRGIGNSKYVNLCCGFLYERGGFLEGK